MMGWIGSVHITYKKWGRVRSGFGRPDPFVIPRCDILILFLFSEIHAFDI